MMFPAGILVVIVLAAIAVDLTLVRNHQRRLELAAQAAANDASTLGIDEAALRSSGELVLAPDGTERAVAESMAAQGLPDSVQWTWRFVDATTVEVTVFDEVDYVYGKALPGDRGSVSVSGVGTGRAVTP